MSGGNFNISGRKKRVLVAPLEWGLGHATRCIPLIRELLALDCEVLLGAEGQSKALLQSEFPQLEMVSTPGFRMRYSRKRVWFPFAIILRVPKILMSIYNERKWLKDFIREKNIDAVISDNRFGLYNETIPCVYITHQLLIKTGNKFTERLVQKNHFKYINRYEQCWVPDIGNGEGLAGELSHPKQLPKPPVTYIGPLSRFEKIEAVKKYDLCIVISGPEPQRTEFEKKLLEEIETYPGKIILVRGLPEKNEMISTRNPEVEIKNHLFSNELNKVLLQSSMFIGRSGYTTVMDLVKLQLPGILIPTPGQPEQEYLAEYLMKKEMFYCVDQVKFSLKEDLKKAFAFPFRLPNVSMDHYKDVLKKFIAEL